MNVLRNEKGIIIYISISYKVAIKLLSFNLCLNLSHMNKHTLLLFYLLHKVIGPKHLVETAGFSYKKLVHLNNKFVIFCQCNVRR